MPKWCQGTVVERKVWTDGLFTLGVRVPEVTPFAAGQFLQLGLYPDATRSEKTLVNRPYSVASPYGEVLEFFIVRVDDGELTPRLWQLSVGDPIEVAQRAAGSFTLKKAPAAETVWLVGTGTGLAPYVAMLREPEIWEKYTNIVCIHGVRYFADLAYTEEMKAFEAQHPKRFRFVQTLTREEQPETLQGRIPGLFENGEIESVTGFSCQADNSTVLLCGNPAMLDTMEEILGKRDMKKHRSKEPGQIVLERYW